MGKIVLPALTLAIGFAVGAYTTNTNSSLFPQTTETLTLGEQHLILDMAATNVDNAKQKNIDRSHDALAALLRLEIDQRQRLEEQVHALQADVQHLAKNLTNSAKTTASDNPESTASAKRNRAIEVETLVSAGFSYPQAVDMKQRIDQVELDKLNLQHQATREGWINSERYLEALAELEARAFSFRDELDANAYDRYLYATGQNNRVNIDSIMEGSTAQQVGLSDGDTIMSYNGKRIYNWGELRSAIFNDSTGPMVPIVINRNGEAIEIYVPQGPLGVRLNMASVDPTE